LATSSGNFPEIGLKAVPYQLQKLRRGILCQILFNPAALAYAMDKYKKIVASV